MKKEVGLWIDHRRAVIVISLDQEEEIKVVMSDMEKRVSYSGVQNTDEPSESHNNTSEDGRDRRFNDHRDRYYDEVISYLRDATAILILGSGEAKGELQKRLQSHEVSGHDVAIKTVDKMTDEQILAEVRQHFRESSYDSAKISRHPASNKEI
jgi:hypothetical protein